MKEPIRTALVLALFLHMAQVPVFAQTARSADIISKNEDALVAIIGDQGGTEIVLGAGFLISENGVIVTNLHAVTPAYLSYVRSRAGARFGDITIIDFDERHDVAIIKVDSSGMPHVASGNSGIVRPGDKVIVLTQAGGPRIAAIETTISQVGVSEDGRTFHLFRSDIAVADSGSPVFNEIGEAIGIVGLLSSEGAGPVCSIPLDQARAIVFGPSSYDPHDASSRRDLITQSFIQNGRIPEFVTIRLGRTQEFARRLLSASDRITYGLLQTIEPHIKKFDKLRYRVDDGIYKAIDALRGLRNDLARERSSDGRVDPLTAPLMEATEASLEAASGIQKALEHRTIKAAYWGTIQNFPSPDWAQARAGLKEIDEIVTNVFGERYVAAFIDQIRRFHPKMEADLLPYFQLIADGRSGSRGPDPIGGESGGPLGIATWKSERLPVVLDLRRNGPADRAKIERGDILLGVGETHDFRSQKDYQDFQRTMRSGEAYRFRIQRGSQSIICLVTLDRGLLRPRPIE